MKKIYIIVACVVMLALPLCIVSNSNKAALPFSSVEGVTSATSVVSTVSKIASKIKSSNSGTSESGTEETSEDTSVGESPAGEVADTTSTSSSSKVSSVLGGVISNVISSTTSSGTLANIVTSVIGLNKMSAETIVGTWNYKEPGVAFTSESLLASAGGEVIASTCKEKLASCYSEVGISSDNTSFTFNEDGTFSAKLKGNNCSGKYTFDEDDQTITLKVLVVTITGYVERDADGMSLLFDSSKILTIVQTIGKISNSTAVSAITGLSSSYDGLQVGFDLSKEE